MSEDSELLKRLKAEQLHAIAAQRSMLDAVEADGRDLSAEENATFTSTNEAYDSRQVHIDELIATERRVAAYEKSVAQIPGKSVDEAIHDDNETLRAMARGEIRGFDFAPPSVEQRAANTKLSAGVGANLVPTGFYPSMFESLVEASSVMAAHGNILTTSTGENLQLPTSNAYPTAALLTEGSTISASDATFGQVTIAAYPYGHTTQVSNYLLTDEAINITEFLSRRGGEALGNGIGAAFITGTGSSQPTGIMHASAGFAGVASASGSTANGFLYNDILTLVHSITRPYRVNASFVCNDSVTLTLRKLRSLDGGANTGTYLWQPSLVAGAPDMLAGYPIYTDPAAITAQTTTLKGLAFGDWTRGLAVRIAGGVRVDSSTDFAFSSDLVTFRFIVRADSKIVDAAAARNLTYLT